MRDDGGVAGPVGHLDGVQGLGQSADLVDLDQNGVGHLLFDAGGQAGDVGDEQVVAHQLHPAADGLCEHGPALPVCLGHAVLQGDDGIGVGKALPHIHQLLLGQLAAGLGLDIQLLLLVPPLGGGGVDGDHEVLAGLIAGLFNGLDDDLQGVLILFQVGGIAALIAHAGGGGAVLLQGVLQGVEHLGAHTQSLAEGLGAHGHDHELLDLHVVGGVRAAVEDVHHGHRQLLGVDAANVVVQGHAQILGSCLGAGQGGTKNGIGAQTLLVGGAVQVDQQLVDGYLIQHVGADQGLGDLGIHVLNSLQNALALVAALVAVTQLASLINAGGSAGGHGGTAHGAVLQIHLYLNGGIAAAVQDLAADDINDLYHLFHGDQAPFKYGGNCAARAYFVWIISGSKSVRPSQPVSPGIPNGQARLGALWIKILGASELPLRRSCASLRICGASAGPPFGGLSLDRTDTDRETVTSGSKSVRPSQPAFPGP